MPLDTQFRFSKWLGIGMGTYLKRSRQNKCFVEGLFNSGFVGLMTLGIAYFYYNSMKLAAVRAVPVTCVGAFVITGVLCELKKEKK